MEQDIPCHMNHPTFGDDQSCVYGHCLQCHNHHCAFDTCIEGAEVVAVIKAEIIRPGQPVFNRTMDRISLN